MTWTRVCVCVCVCAYVIYITQMRFWHRYIWTLMTYNYSYLDLCCCVLFVNAHVWMEHPKHKFLCTVLCHWWVHIILVAGTDTPVCFQHIPTWLQSPSSSVIGVFNDLHHQIIVSVPDSLPFLLRKGRGKWLPVRNKVEFNRKTW